MRRIIIIGTLLAVLGGSAVALAAGDPNTYSGSISVSPAKAGKAKKPVIDGWTQTINVKSAQSGLTAAPLKDIKTWIYGLKVNTKLVPTCSQSTIESSLGTACQKSIVASGTVTSTLGPSNRNPSQAANCGPLKLNVYNGGKNHVWFFFIVPATTPPACPAPTGSAQPYQGTFSRSHGNLVLDVPLPGDVSTNAGGLGLYASLIHEHLVWKKITKKVKGKKVGYFSSVGCKAGKRPFKVTYTDTTNGTDRNSTTQSGKMHC